MMEKMGLLLNKYNEIILYLFWGGLTTIVSWGSYSFFVLIFEKYNLQIGIVSYSMLGSVLFANILSWICAVLFSFFTNKVWVFKSKSWSISVVFPEFGKFVSARLVTGGMEIITVPILVAMGLNYTVLGIEGGWSKILVSILVVILNYFCSKLFIFRK